MRNRKTRCRGGAVIEFALLAPIWLSMLLGTLFLGTATVRGLQVQQAARDLASMYSRGVDFSTASGTPGYEMLQDVTGQLTTLGGGHLVTIFSTITYIGNSMCALGAPPLGTAGNGTPGNPGTHQAGNCKNYGSFVFTQRYTQGTPALRSSDFGTPNVADYDTNTNNPPTYKILTMNDELKNTADQSTFNLIPAPQEEGSDGYQAGSPIYIVEVFYSGVAQAGYTTGASYAYAIF